MIPKSNKPENVINSYRPIKACYVVFLKYLKSFLEDITKNIGQQNCYSRISVWFWAKTWDTRTVPSGC